MSYYKSNPLIRIVILITIPILVMASSSFADAPDPYEASKACSDCHSEFFSGLKGTTHAVSDKNVSKGVYCVNCHDGWQGHIENPAKGNITNGSMLTPAKEAELCSACHLTTHQMSMVSTDPHFRADLSCSSCHTIHGNMNLMLVKDSSDNFCAECHSTTVAEFQRRSAHPLESGNVRCTDCHKLSNANDPAMAIGLNWTCQNCHSDKAGPFPFEHPVVYTHYTNGGGCMECHQPHGSPNDRLLNQPAEGLCVQCHSIPAAHRTKHDGWGTKLPCIECHTDIHGSFDNKKFLDPDLGTKLFPECYQSGCHIFN